MDRVHLHTPHGQAVSAMREGLLPHTQTAMIAGHVVGSLGIAITV